MKVLSLVLALSFIGFTTQAATCPAGSTLVKSCLSTPQAKDSEYASEAFDSIAICKIGQNFGLAIEKSGEQEVAEARRDSKVGSVAYIANLGNVSITLATFVNGKTANNAKLTLNYTDANVSGSSTYSCK